jgi:anti-sigma factor RsiW
VTFFDSGVEQAMQPGSGSAAVGVAEVTHQTIRDQLSDYLDNSLPDLDRRRVHEHLQSCSACRAYDATLRTTIRAVGALPRAQAPASAKQRLRAIR